MPALLAMRAVIKHVTIRKRFGLLAEARWLKRSSMLLI